MQMRDEFENEMHVAQLQPILNGSVKKSSESIKRFWRSCAETKFCTHFTLKNRAESYANEMEFEKVSVLKILA
jgi:hypothetical protein